jgi:uncharacterized protein (DUF111 family)
MSRLDTTISKLEIKLDTCKNKVSSLNTEFEKSVADKQKAAFEELKRTAEALGISLDGISPDGTAEDISILSQRF